LRCDGAYRDDVSKQSVSGARVIATQPEGIFAVLVDARRHVEIDGSDTVRRSEMRAPVRLELGSKFGMKMRLLGMPYRVTNTVAEYEENRLIAWRHLGRHRWRYDLEPIEGGTKVTETFDWSASIAPWAIEAAGYPQRHVGDIERTLNRLEAVATGTA